MTSHSNKTAFSDTNLNLSYVLLGHVAIFMSEVNDNIVYQLKRSDELVFPHEFKHLKQHYLYNILLRSTTAGLGCALATKNLI